MFYPKFKLGKKITNAKVSFTNFENTMDTETDEALLPYKSAKLSYNFNVKKGSLKNGYGFRELSLPKRDGVSEREIIPPISPVKKLWHYKYFDHEQNRSFDELVMYSENGEINSCLLKSDSPFVSRILEPVLSSAVPNAINYRLNSEDSLIFSSASDGMWKYTQNKAVEKIEDSPHIISMCMHYERLFAVVGGERNRLAFSANLDLTNWTADLSSGGFIDMQDERGGLSKVLSFNDYIYVFRDFGVAKISAYGSQLNFSVSQLFTSSVKLYGNSVTLCGDKMLLLARNGLHVFDGYSTKKLNLGIDSLFNGVENENACGVYYHNKFLLACRLNFNDGDSVGCEAFEGGYINNAIIELDLSTNEISITRGVDISSFLALDDGSFCKVVASFNGEHAGKLGELTTDGKVFGKVLPKKWVSPKSNMGEPTKIKHIKECLIKTKCNCKVYVATEKEKKEYQILGAEKSQRVKLNIHGEQIEVGFETTSDGDTEISCPIITVGITN